MAFVSKLGNILKQNVSKTISSGSSISSPAIFQAIRCMSSSKLFIGGLSYSTDNQSLGEAFSSFGEVHEARVIMDRETGRSRGFGFVTFGSEEEASRAMSAMDGKDLHGRMVRVNYANDRTGGGGFRSGGGYGGGGGYNDGGYGGGGGYQTGGFGGGGSGYNNVESGGYTGGSGSGYPPNGGGGGFDVAPTVGGSDNFVGGGGSGYAPPSSGYAPPSGGGDFGEPSVSGGYGQDDPVGGDDEPADFADRRG
ncbi:hypothetical protein ACHQM5_006684 [Ranunculus cassubicifolius]